MDDRVTQMLDDLTAITAELDQLQAQINYWRSVFTDPFAIKELEKTQTQLNERRESVEHHIALLRTFL